MTRSSPVPFLVLVLLCIVPAVVRAEDPEVLAAKGVEKVNAGAYEDAVSLLVPAAAQEPDNPEILYYTGLALSRVGRYAEAETYLRKTLSIDPGAGDAYFELALLYARTGRCEDAERAVGSFRDISGDGELVQVLADAIGSCRGDRRDKRLDLVASLGGHYDTNVILEPDNPPVDRDGQDDVRGLFSLSSAARVYEGSVGNVRLNYDFYQSLHKERSAFNVTYNRLTPSVEFPLAPWLTPSVAYAFEYDLLSGDAYSRFHVGRFCLKVKEAEAVLSEFYYEYRDQAYWSAERFPGNSLRSGFRNSVGLRQYAVWRGVDLVFHAGGDFDRADKDFWSFDGFRLGADVSFDLWEIAFGLQAAYEERRYKEDFPGAGEERLDRMQNYTVTATYFLSQRIGLTLANTTTLNDSNLNVFEYTRNITGLFVSVGIL